MPHLQDIADQRHLQHLLLTDEDIEYAVLFAIMGDTDFNTAAHATLAMKGITDPVLGDQVWRASNANVRMSWCWAQTWLKYGYGVQPGEENLI